MPVSKSCRSSLSMMSVSFSARSAIWPTKRETSALAFRPSEVVRVQHLVGISAISAAS